MTGSARSISGVDLRWGTITHVGRVRTANEDALLAEPPIFVVADGMGGHEAGEIASGLLIESLTETARESGLAVTFEDVRAAIRSAHNRIRREGSSLPRGREMGTTLVVAALLADVAGPRWLLASVGDSRIYRVAGGATEQMTDDHSVVQELLDSGEISLAEAAVHPDRHVITRAIGIGRDLLVDYQVHPVREGDRLVLCSDGVHGALSDAQFASLAAAFPGEPQTAATGLAEAVLASPASDNLTVVVVDACAVESAFELDQAAIQDTTPRPRTDAPADH